jgi:hypothetical protein
MSAEGRKAEKQKSRRQKAEKQKAGKLKAVGKQKAVGRWRYKPPCGSYLRSAFYLASLSRAKYKSGSTSCSIRQTLAHV